MKITLSQLDDTIAKYISEYVIPNTKSDFNKFVLGAMQALGKLSASSMQSSLHSLGLLTDGEVDVDLLVRALEGGFSHTDTISLMGLRFNRHDLDDFKRLLG